MINQPRNLRARLRALDRLIADATARLALAEARLTNWTAVVAMTPPHADAYLIAVSAEAKAKAAIGREAHRLRLLRRARTVARPKAKPKHTQPLDTQSVDTQPDVYALATSYLASLESAPPEITVTATDAHGNSETVTTPLPPPGTVSLKYNYTFTPQPWDTQL